MSSIKWPEAQENYVPSYQLSAVPYITSSIISSGEVHEYNFTKVTKSFVLQNRGSNGTDEIAFAFTSRGLETTVANYNSLSPGEAFTGEVRTVKLFVSGSSGTNIRYQLFVELTNIPRKNFVILTGSNGYQGVG